MKLSQRIKEGKGFRCFQRMQVKILVLCLACTLAALGLQTILFQKASSDLIYRQSKGEIEKSLENLQEDIYELIKTTESGMIDIYKQDGFVRDLKAGVDIDKLRERYYRLAYNLGTESFDTSNGVVSLYLYNMDHQIISTYRRAVTPKHNYPTDIYQGEEQQTRRVKEYAESEDAVTMITSYYNPYREKNILRFVMKIYSNSTRSPQLGYVVCDVDSKAVRYRMEKYHVSEDAFFWLQPLGDRPVYQMGTIGEDEEAWFQEMAEQICMGDQKTTVSSADDGRISSHTDQEAQVSSQSAGQATSRSNHEKHISSLDSDRVLFQVNQKKYNLTAYALMPQSLLRENQRILSRNLLLSAAAVIFLAAVLSVLLSRMLTRPLEDMTAAVKKIKAGDTQLRITDCRADEIGELGRNFNEMLDQLETLVGREYEARLMMHQAQYHALQAQINPHFLYNTLDTMGSIADIRGCPEVSALCQSLSNIFRYSLDMKNPLSTVAGEIVHLKNYIYVMNVRMQEEVEYIFNIDDAILKSSMPRISIQPLVENALTHGLRGSRKKKRIEITARREGEDLLIAVEDNGIGIPEEERRELLNPDREHHTDSVGLINIHSRMKLLYGEEYGVTIESRIGEGTRVTLRIPSAQAE